MENDIFNTNLLQLPMKAQVADEGVVQDIAPVAALADLAGGVAELELDALNQRGVVLQRLSDVTPKNHEMLASGRLQCGEITLLCGDGGVGKGQFVAQIARSLTMGEATEVFPQAPERTGNVVILAGEDPIDAVLCPRMAAAGADLGKVVVIDSDVYYKKKGKMPYLGDPDLVNWIIAANPLVLVVDPLQAFFAKFCQYEQPPTDAEGASRPAHAGTATWICHPTGDPYQQKSIRVWAQAPEWIG